MKHKTKQTTMIPFITPDLTGNERRYLDQCITSTYVSSVGPFVDQFEEAVGKIAGSNLSAVATSSGTTGLHVALVALGVGHGDIVIVPSFTFIASANTITHANAQPWLIDIDRQHWGICPKTLEETLAHKTVLSAEGELIQVSSGKRVAAIMVCHTMGLPADMQALTAIATKYGLPILADGAAALGSTYLGKGIGAIGASLTVVSFNGNKIVTAGGGGAVIGNDAALLAKVRHLSTTARTSVDYSYDQVGYNYRMTNLQAAVGLAQLERLGSFLTRKVRIRKTYENAFASISNIYFFPRLVDVVGTDWVSGILLDPRIYEDIDAIRKSLQSKNIDSRPFWKPVHLQPVYMDAPKTKLDVTESIWKNILTLPCSSHLTEQEQRYVITTTKDVLSACL